MGRLYANLPRRSKLVLSFGLLGFSLGGIWVTDRLQELFPAETPSLAVAAGSGASEPLSAAQVAAAAGTVSLPSPAAGTGAGTGAVAPSGPAYGLSLDEQRRRLAEDVGEARVRAIMAELDAAESSRPAAARK